MLSLWGVSQEEDPCSSEMLRNCGSPGSGSVGRRYCYIGYIPGWVRVGSESCASWWPSRRKEQCTLPLSVRESLSAVILI